MLHLVVLLYFIGLEQAVLLKLINKINYLLQNTFRSEAQSQLTSFLDAASGFYIQLLDDLCQAFHINIPYRVHSSKLVFLKGMTPVNNVALKGNHY